MGAVRKACKGVELGNILYYLERYRTASKQGP
jgi:hypothetical protein